MPAVLTRDIDQRSNLLQSICSEMRCFMQKSKSVAKRQAEEAADTKADRAAKRLRLEMKHRGHEVR